MKHAILTLCLASVLFSGCSKIEKTDLPEPIDFGELITWGKSFIQSEVETTGSLVSDRNGIVRMYACTPNNVYVRGTSSPFEPVSKELAIKAHDLLQRNDTLFALMRKENINGEVCAVDGQYFMAKDNFWWEKDEKGLYKNLRKQMGVAKNSKGVQYRVKHNTETVNGVTHILPSEVEKFIENKWVVVKMPANEKNCLTNIFIASNDMIYLTGIAGTFDGKNHFIQSETGPAFVINTKDSK